MIFVVPFSGSYLGMAGKRARESASMTRLFEGCFVSHKKHKWTGYERRDDTMREIGNV